MKVPDVLLEQYRLGELPRDEAARLERLLHSDETLRQRLRALEESDEAIAGRYPSEWLAKRVRERLTAETRTPPAVFSRPARWALASALAGIAVVIALAVPRSVNESDAGGDRIKGLQPTLTVYRRTARGSETLADGAAARAGDLLRVGYVSAGRGYGVILSIDGRGIVTLHLPPDGTHAATLTHGGTILLDAAYELDDAPAWERFYFVTGDRPFEVAPVMDAARRAAVGDLRAPPPSLPIPGDLQQTTFSIQKEVRP